MPNGQARAQRLGRVRSQWQCRFAPAIEFIATKRQSTRHARIQLNLPISLLRLAEHFLSCIHIKNGRRTDMILRPFIALAAAALAPLSFASDKVNDVKEVHLRQLNDDNFDSSIAKGAW